MRKSGPHYLNIFKKFLTFFGSFCAFVTVVEKYAPTCFNKNFNKTHPAGDLRSVFPENGGCPFAGKATESREG